VGVASTKVADGSEKTSGLDVLVAVLGVQIVVTPVFVTAAPHICVESTSILPMLAAVPAACVGAVPFVLGDWSTEMIWDFSLAVVACVLFGGLVAHISHSVLDVELATPVFPELSILVGSYAVAAVVVDRWGPL
jgi:hypothetical protein